MRGKALFVRNYRTMGPEQYVDLGYTWAIIPWIWMQKDGSFRKPNDSMPHYLQLSGLGIPIYLMAYVRPGKWKEAIRDTAEMAYTLGLKGIILDAEKELKWEPVLAESMARYARRHCQVRHLDVGLTSYGSAQVHTTFPYESFAPYMDLSIPQLYDTSLRLTREYFEDGINAWFSHGFRNVIPAYSEFKKSGNRTVYKLPFEMRKYLSLASEVEKKWSLRANTFWTRPGVPRRQAQIMTMP